MSQTDSAYSPDHKDEDSSTPTGSSRSSRTRARTKGNTASPYPRSDFYAEERQERDRARGQRESRGRDWGRHHRFKNAKSLEERIAFKLLRESAPKLCATTLFEPAYNGGRNAELFAWLLEGEHIDGHGEALHAENREVELSEPELHLGGRAGEEFGGGEAGQTPRRHRVNRESGYISGESTAVVIADRPTGEFMELVSAFLESLEYVSEKKRSEARALAKQLKVEGDHRDVDIVARVIEHIQ